MARLHLSLFGAFQAALDERVLVAFESDKARALLAYLALEADRPHRRETLAGLLWPDIPDASARQSLRQTLFTLRQTISDTTAQPPYLLTTRDTLQFNVSSDHALDVADFQVCLKACDQHTHKQIETCDACAGRLQQAVGLYRGKFLQDFYLADSEIFEEWVALTREGLQRRALEALTQLASYRENRGEFDAALQWARRQLELDAWREEAHRQVMRALALSGKRNEALTQYETCKRLLASELDVEPEAETQTLYEQIKRDQLTRKQSDRETGKQGNQRLGRQGAEASTLTSSSAHLVTSSPLRNLPTALTPFIGRAHELAELAQLIANPEARLIVLVGPGGAGKTRLAIQAATEAQSQFAQGITFVSLASVAQSELIVSAIADALGLKFQGAGEPQIQLLNALQAQHHLLVLDNFEHLLNEQSIGFVLTLLQDAPQLKLLVTSRESLQLQSEWVYEVAGLNEDAQALFLQSAQRIRVGFAPTVGDTAAIKHICSLVGGLPLGIELAATWVRTLSCAEIVQELERGLDILTTTARDLPARHRSLQVVFEHSWQLLSEAEQGVMQQLSVFRGGFSREAAQAVAGASLPLLSALVAKSLVRRIDAQRYDLHELVKQFTAPKLSASGAEPRARLNHANYFVAFAESTMPNLNGADQFTWFGRLHLEQNNVRAVFDAALQPSQGRAAFDGFGLSVRLVDLLYQFWFLCGYHHEALERLSAMFARPEAAARTVARAQLLTAHGYLLWSQRDFAQAETSLTEAVDILREANDTRTRVWALNWLGRTLNGLGRYAAARVAMEESLTLWQMFGDPIGIANSIRDLADIALMQGDDAQAQQLHAQCYQMYIALKDSNQSVYPSRRLAYFELRAGHIERAAGRFLESLNINRQIGDSRGETASLAGLAAVALYQGQLTHAARLYGAVTQRFTESNTPLLPTDHREYERNVDALRAQLSPAEFAAAWAEGRAWSEAQTLEFALALGDPS